MENSLNRKILTLNGNHISTEANKKRKKIREERCGCYASLVFCRTPPLLCGIFEYEGILFWEKILFLKDFQRIEGQAFERRLH